MKKGKNLNVWLVISMFLLGMDGMAGSAVNSNSIVEDGIEYYMQADKAVYNLGEEVQMLYRVTNLGNEDVTFSFPHWPEWNFWVEKDGEHIWRAVNGWYMVMTVFTLSSGESKDFPTYSPPYIWNMRDNNDNLVNVGEYDVIGGLYAGTGEYDSTRVSVHIEIVPEPAMIYYVDDDATGANDGSSWADAYNYLQDGLTAASSGDEIWVAQGNYKPDQGVGITPGDRIATFQLKNGVTLKSGCAGFGEPDPNARDVEVYETILSGDLNGNDIDVNDPVELWGEPSRADNSYHVVTGSGTDATAILDGFTITGGYANGEGWPVCLNRGGGIYSDSGSPTLMNCTISGNSASVGGGIENHGGGMYNHLNCNPTIINCAISRNNGGGIRSSGSPMLINCTISGNNGCGMINGLGSPTLTNCTISGNNGGGWDSCDSYSTLINCVFVGNSSDWDGGAWFSVDSDSVLVNCVFVGNSASGDGGGIYSTSDYSMTLTNCILWGNSDSGGMDASAQIDGGGSINYCCIQGGLGGTGNIDADPFFVEPGYWDVNGVWVEGDYHLLAGSPCIDAGDPNYIAEPNETDLDGRPRVIGGRIDMGAFEYSPPIPAEVRIVPRSINLASMGKLITCYIWLPEDYNVADIEANSVFLEYEIQAQSLSLDEGQQVATAKFNRSDVQEILDAGEVELTITGRLTNGFAFEGTDVIRVIDKGRGK